MALGKKTGGRGRGTPNRASAAKAAEIAASGLTPLDFMLSVLRNESSGHEVRMDAAKAAAPYVHARLAAVEHEAGDGLRSMIADIIASRRARVSEIERGE